MKKGLRDVCIYTAGVLTIPLLFVGYRAAERISHNFDPSYTGRTISGYVVNENRPVDPFGVYELDLQEGGKTRRVRIDCSKQEDLFRQVKGKALEMEDLITPGDFVEFQVTKNGEPTWLWDFDKNTCPVSD